MKSVTHQVPNPSHFNYAVLEYANKVGVEFHCSKIAEAMADHFNLSPEARRERTKEKNGLCYKVRTSRALSNFTRYGGLLCRTRRGYYEITDVGRREISRLKGPITFHYIKKTYRYIPKETTIKKTTIKKPL